MEWFDNTLKSNTIRCKKFATIVLGWKNVARSFFRQKQVSTSAKMHTLLLHFGIRAYLISPEEGSCYVFSIQNNCCEFLASDVLFFKVIKPFFKTPVFGAPLTSRAYMFSHSKKKFLLGCKIYDNEEPQTVAFMNDWITLWITE